MLRAHPAGPRAFDWARFHSAVRLHAEEALRRRARDDHVPEIEQRGERGRVAAAQALVQGEWRVDEWGLEPLRQVRLEDVARADVLDDAGDGL